MPARKKVKPGIRIRKMGSRKWSQREIDILTHTLKRRAEGGMGGDFKDVAAQIGRSRDAVQHQAMKMGLRSPNTWAPEEIAFLNEAMGTMPAREIAKAMQRTESSVRNMLRIVRMKQAQAANEARNAAA